MKGQGVADLKIGMIGVGQIAKNHLRQYSEIEGVEIAAACDINDEELQKVCEQYAIADRYSDYHEMLAREDLDAVDVCLHNSLHAPATIAALKADKHVYCEKPIAGTYADGKAMVETAEACGKKLHIQLGTLYQKETKAAMALIEAGKLGNLYHARSTGYRRRGRPFVDGYGTANFVKKEVSAGGALYDMGVYHIAQILYLLGTPQVERISGKIYQETEMDPARRAESGYNVEEFGVGLVRFSGGLTLDIAEAWAIHLDAFEGSYVVGSSGGVRLSPFGFFSTFCDMEMNGTLNLNSADTRRHSLREDEDAYDSSQKHWVAVLQGRVPLLPTAQVALQTMLIQEGIYTSDKLGREIEASEVDGA
jgi:predicted dehydrogenase